MATDRNIVTSVDLVPQDHLLRIIDKAIDWTFIYDLVKDKYSHDTGRPSMDPVTLIKIPLIQYLYGIKSMRQTVKEIEVNVAYRWFLETPRLMLPKKPRVCRGTGEVPLRNIPTQWETGS